MTPKEKFNAHVYITITGVALKFQRDSGYQSYKSWADYVNGNIINRSNIELIQSISFPIVKHLVGVYSFSIEEAMDYIIRYFGTNIYKGYIEYADALSRTLD